ncbi:hypothetical protein QKW60_13220 [Defluviimonas aestuarii]|uniref:hypothetical protein n=1 Tax=Albidovulum aestuarii TaxID=1130726 RepID=UPI00249CEE30|nr:hypothetical protein [Defluviimonas aestuarii]MDI3337374.1 hypothetical protein [Defluviimonas aestuarii]
MRRLILTMGLCLAAPALAEDWQALSGAEITEALAERKLTYENGAVQIFRESGATTYSVGSGLSEGRWRVEGDEYCSNWPPAAIWSCYALERDVETGRLRFAGATGDMTVGSYSDE